MGIRWSPAAVEQSMGEVSSLLDSAEPFIGRAKERVNEAKTIPNLPEYVKQRLGTLNMELGRIQDMRRSIQVVLNTLPQENLKKERATGLVTRPKLIG